MTDRELQQLAKSNPEAGYRAVFDQYFNYVYAIVFRILRDCAAVADIDTNFKSNH